MLATETMFTPAQVPFISNLSLSNVFLPVTACTPLSTISAGIVTIVESNHAQPSEATTPAQTKLSLDLWVRELPSSWIICHHQVPVATNGLAIVHAPVMVTQSPT